MIVARSISAVQAALETVRAHGSLIALVPTMGFLHQGHLSLIDAARAQRASFVVVSLFVNPTQFGPGEDFNRYPRDEKRDLELLESKETDLVFLPSAEEIYPPGASTSVKAGSAARGLEGQIRPGHFDGVATVVLKLFNIIRPDLAVFGQKDAQQCAVIRQLVRDLDVPVRLTVAPTKREPDGLAMSSRNVYLSDSQRPLATTLHNALEAGRVRLLEGGSVETIEEAMDQHARSLPGSEIDYLRLVDPQTFERPTTLSRDLLLVGAIRLGNTRLIDNIPVSRFDMPCRSTRPATKVHSSP